MIAYHMLTIKRAQVEDAEEITKIKTVAFNEASTIIPEASKIWIFRNKS